jgi:hypothetical protein
VGEASGLLDEQVDRFGAPVEDAVAVEPGQTVLAPHLQGPAEAVRERADDCSAIRLPSAAVVAW